MHLLPFYQGYGSNHRAHWVQIWWATGTINWHVPLWSMTLSGARPTCQREVDVFILANEKDNLGHFYGFQLYT